MSGLHKCNVIVSLCDAVRCIQAIVGVIQYLQVKAQTAKLALYVQFRRVLMASVVFSSCWAIYGVVRSSEVETVRQSHIRVFA